AASVVRGRMQSERSAPLPGGVWDGTESTPFSPQRGARGWGGGGRPCKHSPPSPPTLLPAERGEGGRRESAVSPARFTLATAAKGRLAGAACDRLAAVRRRGLGRADHGSGRHGSLQRQAGALNRPLDLAHVWTDRAAPGGVLEATLPVAVVA